MTQCTLAKKFNILKSTNSSWIFLCSEIQWGIRTIDRTDLESSELQNNKTFRPFVQRVTNRIGRILKQVNIKTIVKHTKKIKENLSPAKDRRVSLTSYREGEGGSDTEKKTKSAHRQRRRKSEHGTLAEARDKHWLHSNANNFYRISKAWTLVAKCTIIRTAPENANHLRWKVENKFLAEQLEKSE